jgi:hypothetical protein
MHKPAEVGLLRRGNGWTSAAEEYTQQSEPIETDRPNTSNSTSVVPVASLQNENGTNVSRRNGAGIFERHQQPLATRHPAVVMRRAIGRNWRQLLWQSHALRTA